MRPVRLAARNRANVASRRLTTASSCTTALHEDSKSHEDLEVALYKTILRGLRTLRAFLRDRRYPFASAFSTVFTSLSPRPARLTSRIACGPSAFAIR